MVQEFQIGGTSTVGRLFSRPEPLIWSTQTAGQEAAPPIIFAKLRAMLPKHAGMPEMRDTLPAAEQARQKHA
jgi:hypothetical protein